MLLLVIYVGGALTVSFICSILEATLLSARVVELIDRKTHGDRGAALMLDLKHERIDDAISAILTLNTVANTLGSALAGAQAAIIFGSAWVGVFSGVLTLLILIFTEIIPKTLGTVHASRLVGVVARTINWLTRLLALPLAMLRLLTRALTPGALAPRVSRRQVAALVTSAANEGAIDEDTSRVVSNVLRLREVKVEDVMTPRTIITMLPSATTIAEFLKAPELRAFSRIPLYETNHDDLVGHVLQREVLAAAAKGTPPETKIKRFIRPTTRIREDVSVAEVLDRLIEERQHLAVVVDGFGGTSGIVTLEDLVETAFGVEILDETDTVADLRAEALKRRTRRLEQIEAKRTRESEAGNQDTAAPETNRTG